MTTEPDHGFALQTRWPILVLFWLALVAFPQSCCSGFQNPQVEQTEFFESRIRPVLVEHCYECHNSAENAEADFVVDWRTGIRTKSEHGTGVVPGKPDESLLIKVIEHEIGGLEMPDGRAKLDPAVIADFKKWIADGAIDPRDKPPTQAELNNATSWTATLEQRKKWWSLQPIQRPELPPENTWSSHPIDRFIYDAATAEGLQPNPPADLRVLTRRLTFALTGLPPTIEQLQASASGSTSFDQQVEELMGSPHYGERWARHWMDLVRYADSHGSEGDPAIPNAYQYRDYLIRALNADVPYDQLVREHIAGDLLPTPRINEELGVNESVFGPAYWRFCFHGFAPTDALDEKVRFTDDQINVLGKAFMGLTISCARCHDHKFDAISQADYYAMFGVVGSCRPAMNDANTPEKQNRFKKDLLELKSDIKTQLLRAWKRQLFEMTGHLLETKLMSKIKPDAARQPTHVMRPYQILSDEVSQGTAFEPAWEKQVRQWKEGQPVTEAHDGERSWDLTSVDDFGKWFVDGNGISGPSKPGELTVSSDGDIAVSAIYPAGVFTNLISDRHRGVMGSPRFEVDDDSTAWIRLMGGGQATVRYAVQYYPRSGTVYPISDINQPNWHWQRFNLDYWQGDQVHLELATAKDAPLQVRYQDRSWFGVQQVVVRKSALGPPRDGKFDFLSPLFEAAEVKPPKSTFELALCYVMAAKTAIDDWQAGKLTDEQALFLNSLVRDGVLSNKLASLPEVKELVQRYRELESKIPQPVRVPGVTEADAFDQPLFIRGDHHKPAKPVRRRFLEAIDSTPYQTQQSGRLELANDLFRDDNPLTSRVIVNRIWQYLFGEGLVTTPDNFGQLGSKPSHPELLDYLATRMVEYNWSIKDMIRFIVSSKTWQQSSRMSEKAQAIDPENRWLTHANLRRLDAESIRDAAVMIVGQMEDKMYGPGFPADSNSGRRSVYVLSNRNSLDKFLEVFDSPIPFATTGRRSSTNVPAQSLTLMNSPFVIELANRWAQRVRSSNEGISEAEQVSMMFESAMGRPPQSTELDALVDYVALTRQEILNREGQTANLNLRIDSATNEIREIMSPVRERLLKQKSESADAAESPAPLAHWKFSDGAIDLRSQLKLELKSGAELKTAIWSWMEAVLRSASRFPSRSRLALSRPGCRWMG